MSITFRRPNMSLREPAREKETEDAIDHPDTTQPRSSKSPRSVAMGKRMEVATINPQDTGATMDDPTNWHCQRRSSSKTDVGDVNSPQ